MVHTIVIQANSIDAAQLEKDRVSAGAKGRGNGYRLDVLVACSHSSVQLHRENIRGLTTERFGSL